MIRPLKNSSWFLLIGGLGLALLIKFATLTALQPHHEVWTRECKISISERSDSGNNAMADADCGDYKGTDLTMTPALLATLIEPKNADRTATCTLIQGDWFHAYTLECK